MVNKCQVQKLVVPLEHARAGISNTRPAWCGCAARVILKKLQNMTEIPVLSAIKAPSTLYWGPRIRNTPVENTDKAQKLSVRS